MHDTCGVLRPVQQAHASAAADCIQAEHGHRPTGDILPQEAVGHCSTGRLPSKQTVNSANQMCRSGTYPESSKTPLRNASLTCAPETSGVIACAVEPETHAPGEKLPAIKSDVSASSLSQHTQNAAAHQQQPEVCTTHMTGHAPHCLRLPWHWVAPTCPPQKSAQQSNQVNRLPGELKGSKHQQQLQVTYRCNMTTGCYYHCYV